MKGIFYYSFILSQVSWPISEKLPCWWNFSEVVLHCWPAL